MDIDNHHGRVFRFDFRVDRRADGSLAGFTLEAQKQAEAEFFCKSYPMAMFDNNASIGLCEHGLRLKNALCPFQPADLCMPLSQQEIEEFQKFYEGGGLFEIHPHEGKIGFSVIHD
jgi:hypothetical protein